MKVRTKASVDRPEVEGPGWTRGLHVEVEVVLDNAARGDAVLGALDAAWKGARHVVADTLEKTR